MLETGVSASFGVAAVESSDSPRVLTPRRSVALMALLCLALYLPGIRWGLPATTSWSQDTIAGVRTLGAVAGWPDDWHGRYPPLHYLVLRAVSEPVLRWWEHNGELQYDPDSGTPRFAAPHAEKIGTLILIARIVSLVMAFAAGVGIWAAARLLTGDERAALLAALSFLTGAGWVYFAHLGNVDVPSVCWFAWSTYFYIRTLRNRRWTDALLLGLFGSLAISTKDPVAGVYPGMALVLLILETKRLRRDQPTLAAFLMAGLQWRWLIGVIAFALPYLFVNGVFHNLGAYAERMKYWLDITPDTIHARQYRYESQFALAVATLWYAAGAVGWPMLAAMVISVFYTIRRHTRVALVVLTPAATYYVVVIARIDFVYSRFLFPTLALMGILVGLALADLWRSRTSIHVRALLTAIVFVPTLTYATAIDAEMITDSRYAAERWFLKEVDPTTAVGAFSKPQYLPRLAEMGYPTYGVEMAPASFSRPQPEYLVLTSYNHEDFDADQQACLRDLLRGKLGYEPIVAFRGRFLGTGSHWLSLAGWFAPTPGKISPTITVLSASSTTHDSTRAAQ